DLKSRLTGLTREYPHKWTSLLINPQLIVEGAGMDLQLKGKRALVTGSNSGIGKGIARMMIEEGCSVDIHGRNRERAESTARELGAAGYVISDLATDVGAEETCKAAQAVLGGHVDILVNNAGGSAGSARLPAHQIDIGFWTDCYQKNTLA